MSISAKSLVEPLGRSGEPSGVTLRRMAGVMLGLLFLIGPLSDLIDSSLDAIRIAGIAAGFALFVALYALTVQGALRIGAEAMVALLAALAALAVVMLAAGAPSSFDLLFVFFVAAAGMRLKTRPALQVVQSAALFRASSKLGADQSIATSNDSLRFATDALREGSRSELLGALALIALAGVIAGRKLRRPED